jgi:hypothetical protein
MNENYIPSPPQIARCFFGEFFKADLRRGEVSEFGLVVPN